MSDPGFRWARAALLAAAGLLLLAGLGSTDLWAPDEPRYAQIAEELRAHQRGPSDWVLLHLGGEPYTQKPPLYYWLAALAGAPGGRVSEFAARLPSALAGIGCVWLTLQLGVRLFGRAPGLWAAALLLTSFSFAHLARRAQLDVVLTLFETLALLAFWRLECGRGSTRRNRFWLHAWLGLAVLTKGPVGLLPLAAMGVYLAWEGRGRELRPLLAPGWLAISIGPALAWLGCASWLAPAGFAEQAVLHNLLERFFAGTSHPRPFYYFGIHFPLDFLPGTLLWPAVGLALRRQTAGRADPQTRRPWRALVAWLGVFVVFFSLSAGKRGLYLLPAFPAAALLCGAALDAALARRATLPGAVSAALAAAAAALVVGGWLLWAHGGLALDFAPGFSLPASFGAIGAVLGAAAFAACWLLARAGGGASGPLAVALVVVLGVELAVFGSLFPAFDAQKSPRPVALAATRWTRPDQRVGLFANRSLLGGLVYYGDRAVVALPDTDSVRSFVASGGGAIVARKRDLERLQRTVPVDVREELRAGRRSLVVATAQPGSARSRAPAVLRLSKAELFR